MSRLRRLKNELLDYKNEFEALGSLEEGFDAKFRAEDPDCENVKPLSTFDLYISTALPLEHKGIQWVHMHVHVHTCIGQLKQMCTNVQLEILHTAHMYACTCTRVHGVHVSVHLNVPTMYLFVLYLMKLVNYHN